MFFFIYREKAKDLLGQAKEVNEALNKTEEAQKNVTTTIDGVVKDIDAVRKLIDQLSNTTKDVQTQINETTGEIKNLNNKMQQLQNNITNNYNTAKRLQQSAGGIKKQAESTYYVSTQLQADYDKVRDNLDDKLQKVQNSKARVERLFNKALNLMAKVTNTENEINQLDKNPQEDKLKELENAIDGLISRMQEYNKLIEARAVHYNVCT